MRRNIFDEIHDDFRATAREFFERECVPNTEKWERDGKVSREAWLAAGAAGLIGWEFDEKYGGLGVKDFRFNQIISENPTSPEAYENLGEAYLQQHDNPNALAAFQRSIDLGSKSEDARRKLAALHAANP